MKKRALISVFDKEGLSEFAGKLVEKFNYEIISTGSTYKFLTDNKIPSIEVRDVTEMDEMLSGKVKTLHPAIHGAILADTEDSKELSEIEKLKITPIDMVIVNFYPFKDASKKHFDTEELIKNIDIGGPTMLRAAAKNYKRVTAVPSTDLYNDVIKNLEENKGSTTLELREKLAIKVFEQTVDFDSNVLNTLSQKFDSENSCYYVHTAKKIKDLRYGENPHQKASLYKNTDTLDYEILNGKELSYNNILDVTAATNIISEFYDVCATAIVKHNAPCGVALGKDINEAYVKAFDCDPVSAFGGIIAFSQVVNESLAKQLATVFLEVVIAPDYTPKALDILKEKKNLRVIKLNTPLKDYKNFMEKEIKITPFGTLIQDIDNLELNKDTFNIVTKAKPTEEMLQDMIFAWKVAKHSKSNAIVVAKDFKAIGIGQGQTSRIDAMEIALNRACDGTKDAVIASDGFFPAIDNIHAAAQDRIAAIIQPGGSIKDKDVIDTANKYNIVMVTTGIRHFKH